MPIPSAAARTVLLALTLSVLSACTHLHASVAALPWKDGWGDRGPQVLARDHAMCERLVEQHRALLAGCLASRGWTL
ncbi:MAG: hypothetical protein H6930_03730 [Rhodoferax sp.]|jgi:hypothetical protein|nr:hypothetical protein [Rhodoferax sp.]